MEADIRSFFDTLDHEWLIRFLEHDIADRKFIGIIRRFLKAGIMENGKLLESDKGSPQGNGASPILANVYLHYVLDLWFEQAMKKRCRGESYLIRYHFFNGRSRLEPHIFLNPTQDILRMKAMTHQKNTLVMRFIPHF